MEKNVPKILAVAGKGGVGKTSIAANLVRLLVENFPDKKILAIDADPAVGLSTALGIEVKTTVDDIRKEVDHISTSAIMDCNACNLQQVCDEVEGLRELHFAK